MTQAWRNIFMGSVLAATLLLVVGSHCALAEPPLTVSSSAARTMVVSLRSNVEVDARVIRLTDVAQVTGGTTELREQVKALDLEDALRPGESLSITPTQITFRIRLAGIDLDGISIRGNPVRVTARGTSVGSRLASLAKTSEIKVNTKHASSRESITLENAVVNAAKDCVLDKLPWKTDAVEIRLAQPLPRDISQVEVASDCSCHAELRTAGPAVGRVQVRVIVETPNKPSLEVPVSLEVRHFDDVVLTTRTLERGRTVSAADVYIDRQDVTEMTDYCSNVDQMIGTATKRSVRALVPLRMGDVEKLVASSEAILIKRRDRVKMTARTDAVSVTAMGEALQDGRAGETIRLRNLDSNSIVQGRVTGTNEVEISF